MNLNDIFEMIYANAGEIFAALSAFVAISSALAARRETRKQGDLMTERLRQSIDSASLDWGSAAIDTLARAAMFARTRHLQANDAGFAGGKASLLINLSALIDRGRMFFPNVEDGEKGKDKHAANRGSRPPILDAMVRAHDELQALTREGGPTGENSADYIDECRRLVVSELQAYLDPRRMDQIVGRYCDQDKSDRRDAIHRAAALKAELVTRRPGLSVDGSTYTAPRMEKVQ